MRDIKFRANINNKFSYLRLNTLIGQEQIKLQHLVVLSEGSFEQYTTRKDMKGKEIYEGDRITAKFQTKSGTVNVRGVVEWEEYMFGISCEITGEAYSLNRLINVHVIGNVHQVSEPVK